MPKNFVQYFRFLVPKVLVHNLSPSWIGPSVCVNKNSYHPTRRLMNCAVSAIAAIEDPSDLSEIELISIFDSVVKMYDVYPKLKVET